MGPLEVAALTYFFLILFVWFGLPFICLLWVARQRGRRGAWAWWSLLGWIGLAVGLLMLLTAPRLPKAESTPVPSGGGDAADNLRTLGELRERGLLTEAEFEERRARELERL